MPALLGRILIWQWLATLCIAAVLLVVGRELAISALLGGVTCVLPNTYFARQLFSKYRTAGDLLWTAYGAEFVKLSLSVLLMAIILIHYKGVHVITFFATYCIVQACTGIASLHTQTTTNSTLNQT